MKDMHVFEREVNGRRYRVAAQSVWDPVRGGSVARQAVLGPATAPPVADLSATRSGGTQIRHGRGCRRAKNRLARHGTASHGVPDRLCRDTVAAAIHLAFE